MSDKRDWDVLDGPAFTVERMELLEPFADPSLTHWPCCGEPVSRGMRPDSADQHSAECDVFITLAVAEAQRKVKPHHGVAPRGKPSALWPLIQTLERACWSRKWSEVKKARKALEARIGKRPHDPLFTDVTQEHKG